jgi:hypothetical protein
LNVKLHKLGNKVTARKFNNEIADTLSRIHNNLVKKTLAQCVADSQDLINPAKLWNKDVEEAS